MHTSIITQKPWICASDKQCRLQHLLMVFKSFDETRIKNIKLPSKKDGAIITTPSDHEKQKIHVLCLWAMVWSSTLLQIHIYFDAIIVDNIGLIALHCKCFMVLINIILIT